MSHRAEHDPPTCQGPGLTEISHELVSSLKRVFRSVSAGDPSLNQVKPETSGQYFSQLSVDVRSWFIRQRQKLIYSLIISCKTAAVSCGPSRASAVSTPLRWTFKNTLYKASHSCRIICERSESAGERRTALYKQSSINANYTIF